MRAAVFARMSKDDDESGWVPVLQGEVYCSPRCGGKCTLAAFDKATSDAQALASEMGQGWKPRVWENLGWHYDVGKSDARITPPPYGSAEFTAWIEPGKTERNLICQFIEKAENPHDALGFATQSARTMISRLENSLAEIIEVDQ